MLNRKLSIFKHEMLPCAPVDLEAHVQDVTEQVQALDECKDLIRGSRKFNRSQKSYLLAQLNAISKHLNADMKATADVVSGKGGTLN